MKPDDRTRALNAAAVHLDWLTADPHHRAAAARAILADTATRATIATGSRDDTGRRTVGAHSDPTAAAAGTTLDSTATDRRNAREIRRSTADLAETARFIRATIAGLGHHGPDTLDAALTDTLWSLTVPHSVGAWTTDHDETRGELDHACGRLATEAASLTALVGRVLRSAVRPPSEKPKQRKLHGCVSCARVKRPDGQPTFEPVAHDRYAKFCRWCGEYRAAEGRMPPVAAVAWMIRHGKAPSTKILAEALTAEKARRKGA